MAVLLMGLPAAPPQLTDLQARAQAYFKDGVQLSAEAAQVPARGAQARRSFALAAVYFDQLHAQGVQNPGFFLDQGNAYFLSGDTARAILAYQRGLRLEPENAALQANLTFVRGQVAYPDPGTFGRPAMTDRPPWLPRMPGLLLILGFSAYALACVSFTRWVMVRRPAWLVAGGVALLAAGVLAAGLFFERRDLQQDELRPLVVLKEDRVLVRGGNGNRYPARSETPLNRGVEARLLYERNGWLQIELGDGTLGWVPEKNCVVDRDAYSRGRD